ncbi:MAG: DUF86 domain-containing protein [Bacteroidia bacterium]
MKEKWGDETRLKHILEAIKLIEEYSENKGLLEFETERMYQDACIRQLGIIGEACARMTEELRQSNEQIPWREIVGLRNIVIHEYFGVDCQVIWNVIDVELPILKIKIKELLISLS